jgi:hypothetical protein
MWIDQLFINILLLMSINHVEVSSLKLDFCCDFNSDQKFSIFFIKRCPLTDR